MLNGVNVALDGSLSLGSNPSEASIKKPKLSGFFFLP